ncbi:YkgJ family cysteine cluster protein [Vibrio alginolyticus]|nr:YkgJ family cysteine cluster protein [Vibrio alginolyticus]
MTLKLVSNRECGDCSACCVTLRIQESDLKKQADVPCPNLKLEGGCSIYAERPSVCRNWHCAWLYMSNLGDEWRPDRSGVILRLEEDGLILQAIRDPLVVLTSQLSLELIGGGIENNLSISISVPTRTGYCYSLVRINEHLKPAVISRDFQAAQRSMSEMVVFASAQKTDPIAPLA